MDQTRRQLHRRRSRQDGLGLVYILLAASLMVGASLGLMLVLARA